jgi:DNA primase
LDDTTAAIKNAVAIIDLIGEYVRLEPIGSKFRGLCPFHDDHKPSLQVDPERQNYRCWACGAKGDVFTFVQQIEHISFVDAKAKLAQRAGIALRSHRSARSDHKESLLHVLGWAADLFHKSLFDSRTGSEARQYLHERGLSVQTAQAHGLGYAPSSFDWLIAQARGVGIAPEQLIQAGLARVGNQAKPYDVFRNRLMFPIRTERGAVIGFGGRILPSDDSDGPKYLNTPATDVYNKSRVLYGLDVVSREWRNSPRAPQRVVAVMEGYTDCLMAYQHGLRTAVGTCGTALTAQHVARLRSIADRVVLVFDGDEAGQKAAANATALFLQSELDLKLCTLPGGKDPCDFVQEHGINALRELIDKAEDALDYHLNRGRRVFDWQTLEGKRRAMEHTLGVLAMVPPLARSQQRLKFDLAVNRVHRAFGINEPELRRRIDELRAQGQRATAPQTPPPAGAPMNRWERQVAQWLVSRPSRAGELREFLPTDAVLHPDLRTLVGACYALSDELGVRATVDALRERLNDPRLDALLVDFLEGVPDDDVYERGWADIKAQLQLKQRQKSAREAAARGNHQDSLTLLQ